MGFSAALTGQSCSLFRASGFVWHRAVTCGCTSTVSRGVLGLSLPRARYPIRGENYILVILFRPLKLRPCSLLSRDDVLLGKWKSVNNAALVLLLLWCFCQWTSPGLFIWAAFLSFAESVRCIRSSIYEENLFPSVDAKSVFLILSEDISAHIQAEKGEPREGGALKCTCCISLLTPTKVQDKLLTHWTKWGIFPFCFT